MTGPISYRTLPLPSDEVLSQVRRAVRLCRMSREQLARLGKSPADAHRELRIATGQHDLGAALAAAQVLLKGEVNVVTDDIRGYVAQDPAEARRQPSTRDDA